MTLSWAVQVLWRAVVHLCKQRHHTIAHSYPHPTLNSVVWYHYLLLVSSVLETDDLAQVTILFIPLHLNTELLHNFIQSRTEIKKEKLHWPFKSRFCSKQLWHPVIKKSPVLYNFGSCCFILPPSKSNNWLVLRGFAKTAKIFTVLGSGARLLITLPRERCDNFDNAPQILILPFSLVV